MKRQRPTDSLRTVKITPHINCWAEGSAEISMGRTRVLCTASVSESTPSWLNRPGEGWVTGEYAMLPRSGDFRMSRPRGFNSGRSQEISRLIGRSLRSAVDRQKLGERQITIDCDVLQADGGTRSAAITGGFVALALALKNLKDRSIIKEIPLTSYVCAVSAGLIQGEFFLDLDAQEDKNCETDINFVLNDRLNFVEIQGTAEKQSFTKEQLLSFLPMAQKAAHVLIDIQRELVGEFFSPQLEKSKSSPSN